MTPYTSQVLDRLERYYDLVPRASADVEPVGPLTLFVSRGGWPFYGRPSLGVESPAVTVQDVAALMSRQRELGVPRALEWVHETTPSLLGAAREAGMEVEECPLLVLDVGALPPAVEDARVRRVGPDDEALPLVNAAIHVSFGTPGTGRGAAGVEDRDERLAQHPDGWRRTAELQRDGLTVLYGAFDAAAGAVGGGSHNPRGDVTEVVGVGVLPAFRRRGLAGCLTAALARDAVSGGVATVFCSASDDDVARVYEAVGFRRVGTACIAEAQ